MLAPPTRTWYVHLYNLTCVRVSLNFLNLLILPPPYPHKPSHTLTLTLTHPHPHTPSHITQLVFPAANTAKIYYTFNEGQTFQVQSFTPSTINPRSLLFSPTHSLWAIGHDPTYNKVSIGPVHAQVMNDIRSQFQLNNMSTSLLLALCHRKPGSDVD